MLSEVPLGPTRPRVEWGLGMLRYNRVEGLSSGVDITQDFGRGYSVRLTPRIGIADRSPNAELSLSRTDGVATTALTGYRRLAVIGDWGSPLDFGSGLSALLFGRDEGLYYRAAGAEVAGDRSLRGALEWRLFAEQDRNASVE